MLKAASFAFLEVAVPLGAPAMACLAPISARYTSSLAQAPGAARPGGVDAQQLMAAVQERRLDKVGKAMHFLHSELHLPPGDVQRLLPSLMRAPHFVQNRLRLLRSLGLSNADVAALVRSTPDVLALPPAASAPVLEERMQLLGLRPATLHSFLLQCPAAAPLLLRSRLSAGGIKELRSMVSQLGEQPAMAHC